MRLGSGPYAGRIGLYSVVEQTFITLHDQRTDGGALSVAENQDQFV